MAEFVTPTPPVGEMVIVRERLHGVAVNTLVTPYSAPADWFFMQFPTKEAAQEWCIQNNITFKEKEDGIAGNDDTD